MTTAARTVLNDCRIALQLLEEEVVLDRWRVKWIAAITLIRAVGHVLDKVDGKNAELKKISNSLFKSWKSPAPDDQIFRDFIDLERNNVLKEYEFNYHPLEKVDVAVITTLSSKFDENIQAAEVFELDENIYRPVLGGYREGDDVRDLYSDAIEWWERQLELIDEKLTQ